jgi:hypothetical protein
MKSFNDIKKHSESYAKMMRDLFPSSFEKEELNNILTNIVFDDEKTMFVEKLEKEEKKEEFKRYISSFMKKEDMEESESSISAKEVLDNV